MACEAGGVGETCVDERAKDNQPAAPATQSHVTTRTIRVKATSISSAQARAISRDDSHAGVAKAISNLAVRDAHFTHVPFNTKGLSLVK